MALSGAHTLGRAKPSRSGFGKEVRIRSSVAEPSCRSWALASRKHMLSVWHASAG